MRALPSLRGEDEVSQYGVVKTSGPYFKDRPVADQLDWFEEHLEVKSRLVWDDYQSERFAACFGDPTIWSA
jgi:hypothetical protein